MIDFLDACIGFGRCPLVGDRVEPKAPTKYHVPMILHEAELAVKPVALLWPLRSAETDRANSAFVCRQRPTRLAPLVNSSGASCVPFSASCDSSAATAFAVALLQGSRIVSKTSERELLATQTI